MKKETIIETVIGVGAIVLVLSGYFYLPLEWRRSKDISLGNNLIAHIEQYQKQNGKLPENGDEKTLLQMGFHHNKQGWQPNYRKLNEQQFEIVYADGFTPPYLAWDSQQRQWALRTTQYSELK